MRKASATLVEWEQGCDCPHGRRRLRRERVLAGSVAGRRNDDVASNDGGRRDDRRLDDDVR